MAELDAIRGLSACVVVVIHAMFLTGALRGSYAGTVLERLGVVVPAFFVISGFLLYEPFVRARLTGRGLPPAGLYYWRRAVRVLPPYWIALGVSALLVSLPLIDGGNWWLFAILGQTATLGTFHGGLLVTWSLSVEIVFYALLPLWAALALRALSGQAPDRAVRLELLALAGVAVVAFVIRSALWTRPTLRHLAFAFPGHADVFAAGMALAVAVHAPAGAGRAVALLRGVARRPLACWGAAAAAVLVLAAVLPFPSQPAFPPHWSHAGFQLEHCVYTLCGFLIVAPAALRLAERSRSLAVLRRPAVAWLGLASYGIFLSHYQVVSHLAPRFEDLGGWAMLPVAALAVAIAIVFGAVSWYLVERPLMRISPSWRMGMGRRRPVPVASP
jgi:peptidoglycan/LPS O-acetylase OafA/YrhL